MPERSRKDGPARQSFRTPPDKDRDFLEPATLADEITDYADSVASQRDAFRLADPTDAEAATEHQARRLGIGFWIALGWLVVIVLLALLAPVLPIKDPDAIDGPSKVAPLCSESGDGAPWCEPQLDPGDQIEDLDTEIWILGTDNLGRDILSRTIWGGRVSITVGFFAVVLGLTFGGLIGLVAGFYKGRIESVLMAAMDVLLAFPALLLALAIVTFTDQRNVRVVVLAIGIVAIPPLARLVRANTLVFSEREFVLASRTLGARNNRIMSKEILPNVALPAGSFAIIGIAVAIVAEGGLAFLGLSLPPPTATWGVMINDGKGSIEDAIWISMVPATAMFLTVLALNLAGDTLREFFDVKETGL